MTEKAKKPAGFDPEGRGYDYESASKSGIIRDEKTKHWQSRDPFTGLLLKGRKHKTWGLLEEGEEKAGYKIQKVNGRYYSFPKGSRRAGR